MHNIEPKDFDALQTKKLLVQYGLPVPPDWAEIVDLMDDRDPKRFLKGVHELADYIAHSSGLIQQNKITQFLRIYTNHENIQNSLDTFKEWNIREDAVKHFLDPGDGDASAFMHGKVYKIPAPKKSYFAESRPKRLEPTDPSLIPHLLSPPQARFES